MKSVSSFSSIDNSLILLIVNKMNLHLKWPYNVQIVNVTSCGLIPFQSQPNYDVDNIHYTE